MARTISDIKRTMTDAFTANEAVISAYKLTPGKTFDEQFSKVSLESLLFWAFAVGVWTLETLFDVHRREVADLVAAAEPHTLRWYAQRAKAYLHGYRLRPYSDQFDTSGASTEAIAQAQVIQYAVASEHRNTIYLKVAGADSQGAPIVLAESVLEGMRTYISQIKDAGVAVRVISAPGDELRLTLEVYMQPTLLLSTGMPSEERQAEIRKIIEGNITALPFDGVFRPSDLVVALSHVSGVESTVITSASATPAGMEAWEAFDGYHRPSAGYYHIHAIQVNYHPYEPFRSI